jgi:hypothetical protein
MKRYLTLIGTALLAVSSTIGSVSAQTNTPVNADGSFVVANDDGAPIVSGAGDDISYGDINTGGGGGEVLGDPSAVYSPMVPDNPVEALAPTDSAPVATDTVAADGGFCSQYASWYDAQVAYENLGATAADPALVQEVDPNYDGIACEAMMA